MFRKTCTARGGYGPKASFHSFQSLRKEYERGPSTDKYFTRNPGTGNIQYKGHDVHDHKKWFWSLPGTGTLSGAIWPDGLFTGSRHNVPEKVISAGDVVQAGKLSNEKQYLDNNIDTYKVLPQGGPVEFFARLPRRFLVADYRHNIDPKRYRSPENQVPKFQRGSAQNSVRAPNFSGLLNESMRHTDSAFGRKYRATLMEGLYGPSRTAASKQAKAVVSTQAAANESALVPAGDSDAAAGHMISGFALQKIPPSQHRAFQVAGFPNPVQPVAPVAENGKDWRSVRL